MKKRRISRSTNDVRVRRMRRLITPRQLRKRYPVTPDLAEFIRSSRRTIKNIQDGKDKRLLVLCGPCSIHNEEDALVYAKRLLTLHRKFGKELYIVMRVYFEKPRTTIGWKGLVNDPHLDGRCSLNDGLDITRRILHKILSLGLPVSSEVLDPISTTYMADLLCFGSIGARTIPSQTHRVMASGLSFPVGMKNGTNGKSPTKDAIDAIITAHHRHVFPGIDEDAHAVEVVGEGNEDTVLILRGSENGPNYTAPHVADALSALKKAKKPQRVIIDVSHANAWTADNPKKDYRNQQPVFFDVLKQRIDEGNRRIIGLMLESNIFEGRQDVVRGQPLERGVSITDACIGWDETEMLLEQAFKDKPSRK